MSSRPLEHLVLLSVAVTGNYEEGEEASTVLLAWRILNINKNKVVSEQEVHVKPSGDVPPDSALPQGISPGSLQGAGSLDLALKKLHDGLTKLAGTTFSIMTNGPYPLRQFLHPEAGRLSITLQKYLYHYLDLNKEMKVSFSSAPVTNDLDKMADFLGIAHPGDAPRVGLRELSLFGEIVEKLISEGHVFHKLEVVKQFDTSKSAPERGLVKSDSVVLLKGLPYSATTEDVVGFLTGLNIVPGGIVFGTNQMGRRTGACLVAMEAPELADLAVERNRHYMGQRYVDVSLSTADEFWKLADLGAGGGDKDSMLVLRMQGLPYRVTESEIVDFFAPDANVVSGPDGVLLVRYPDGRASGDGYAVFGTERDLKAALERDRQTITGYSRYVELYRSSVKDLKSVLSTSASRDQQASFSQLLGVAITANPEIENLRGSERKCVKLRGLPYDSEPDDVLEFFGGLKNEIAAKGVHMVLNANNKPTGDCYVQMKSEESARRAFDDLNKKYMGRRYIEVFQCSGDEVARVLVEQGIGGGGGGYRPSPYRGGGGGGGGRRGFGGGGRRRRGIVVRARGLPYSTTEDQVADFFADFDVNADDVELIYNRENRPAGIALVSFQSRDLAHDAIREKNKKYLGGRYIELSFQSE